MKIMYYKNKLNITVVLIFFLIPSYIFPINVEKTLQRARSFILNGQIPQAIQAYAQISNTGNTNSAVFSEYAYALALSGIYEGAVVYLDKAKMIGKFSEEDYFFAGQIFALMGYNQLATGFLKQSEAPKWINRKYSELYKRYILDSPMPQEKDLYAAFKRANYLAASGMYFQSIFLYEKIIQAQPKKYIFHVGYSIPLEKLGFRESAANEMATGLSLLPDDTQDKTKLAFNERFLQLKQNNDKKQVKQPEAQGMKSQGMIYVGGSASSSYTSINGRFGLFFTNSFNASFDLGVSNDIYNNFTTTSVGLSAYQRLGKVFVIGVGFSDQITDTDNMSINPSIGFSFINKERTSSWDIFFNMYYPIADNANYLYGFSIGKSFYFGKRK